MADTLIKMKTGTIAKIDQISNGSPVVPLDEGTVYFAVDTTNHTGKIVYDAPNGNSVDRIIMGINADATSSEHGLMSASDKSKLDSIVFDGSTTTKALTQKGTWETFNNYSHPIGDGNLHVPATGTENEGKVLMAGNTAGSLNWVALGSLSLKSTIENHTYIKPSGLTTRTQDVTLKNAQVLSAVATAGSTPTLGTAFSVPNISKKTVVTEASFNNVIVNATVTNEVLTISSGAAGSALTGDSVNEGTAFIIPNVTGVGAMPTFNTATVAIDKQPTFTVDTTTDNLTHSIL